MPYRDEQDAQRARILGLERELATTRESLDRAEQLLSSVVATLAGRHAEHVVAWRSLPGGEPMRARFSNRTGARVTLAWFGYDGRLHEEATIVPEGVRPVETHSGHLFRAIDDSGRVLWQGYLQRDRREIVIGPP